MQSDNVGSKASSSGHYNFAQGIFDITVFSDGFITLPETIIMPDATPEERHGLLARLGGADAAAPYHSNVPLIRTGSDVILVDVGAGTSFQDTAGRLEANLRAGGVDPETITKVVFTHVHPDHAGATIRADGSLLYPNAQYFVNEAEYAFWTDKDYELHMPEAIHDFARGAQRNLAAMGDRLNLLTPGDEIVPGMLTVNSPGHTPGHVSFELAGQDHFLISGDTATNNIVFFENPAWHFGFDTDPELALSHRRALLDRAASEKIKLLGYHWSYPGVGYAERTGTGYRFVSV